MPVAENWPAVQLVQTLSAVTEAVRFWPGAHGVLGVQAVALAADQLAPAVQLAQTASAIAEHSETRYAPAAHTEELQGEHGAKPVADHVPVTQGGTATQASAVAFHAYAGALQAQLDWPTSALLALYSSVFGHERQVESPSSENCPAAQLLHTMSAVALQVETPSQTVPAAQAVVLVQAAQGARPVADHDVPFAQGSAHVLLAVFQP